MEIDSSSSNGLLSLQQGAVRSGVSVRTLRRYQKQGRLEVVRVGRRIFCTPGALDAVAVPANGAAAAERMLRDRWENRLVHEWAVACRAFVEIVHGSDRLAAPRLRAIEAMVDRFGSLLVREYRLEQLAVVDRTIEADGQRVEELSMLLLLPPQMPVIEALREVRRRFAGLSPHPVLE